MTSFSDWESGLYLAHHGIKGQKWGVRRYQNPDGTLTELGKRREQKEFVKKLKNVGKSMKYSDRKRHQEKEEFLLPTDRINTLISMNKNGFRNLKKITKGKDRTEDSDIDKAYDEYFKEKQKLVEDLVGKYGHKKVIGSFYKGKESARNVVDRAISRAVHKAEDEERSFNDFKNGLKKGKSVSELFKGKDGIFDHDKLDKVFNHVNRKESKLIDDWWKKKTTGSWINKQTVESFNAEAMRYAKKAAKDMGLPMNKETYYFLLGWFFNGDD